MEPPDDQPTVESSPPPGPGVAMPPPPLLPDETPPGTTPPDATTPGPTPPPSQESPRQRSKLLVPLLLVAVLALAGAGAYVLLSRDDQEAAKGGPIFSVPTTTEPPATTGTTGATGSTGAPGDVNLPPLAEAQTFGTWQITLTPQGDTSNSSAIETETSWELAANCESRSGPHPCDVDAVTPVSGFIQRVGRQYEGKVTGELPCGTSDTMDVAFEVKAAAEIEGVWRTIAIVGEGTMLSGACEGTVFALEGMLA